MASGTAEGGVGLNAGHPIQFGRPADAIGLPCIASHKVGSARLFGFGYAATVYFRWRGASEILVGVQCVVHVIISQRFGLVNYHCLVARLFHHLHAVCRNDQRSIGTLFE